MIFELLKQLNSTLSEKEHRLIRDKIIVECIPLARRIASDFYENSYFDYEDIESFALEGLINAIDHYKSEYEVNFYYYINKCMFGSILSGIKPKYELINNITKLFIKTQIEVQKLYGTKYIPGNMDMLKDILDILKTKYNIDEEDIKKIYNVELRKSSYYDASININNVYYFDNSEYNEDYYKIISKKINDKLSTLSPLRKLVLMKRYGFYGKEYSYQEIQDDLLISFHSVKQALYRGLKDLKEQNYDEIIVLLDELNEVVKYDVDDSESKKYII